MENANTPETTMTATKNTQEQIDRVQKLANATKGLYTYTMLARGYYNSVGYRTRRANGFRREAA